MCFFILDDPLRGYVYDATNVNIVKKNEKNRILYFEAANTGR